MRRSKRDFYLDIARECALQGTCLRRNYGAVLVRNDEIIATGYSGAPRGLPNCCDTGICRRQELGVPSGERYELCVSVHAEMNACISAPRSLMIGSTMYLCGIDAGTGEIYLETKPCLLCRRILVNAGIEELVIRRTNDEFEVMKGDELSG